MEDPGIFYRFLWCPRCGGGSIRFHSVRRKIVRRFWVEYTKTCLGIPPYLFGKRQRNIVECRRETRCWVRDYQWDILCNVDSYK